MHISEAARRSVLSSNLTLEALAERRRGDEGPECAILDDLATGGGRA